jgi:hypothetical protein
LGAQSSAVGSTGRSEIPRLVTAPHAEAVMIAISAAPMDEAFAVKLALVAPSSTCTLVGTDNAALVTESATLAPPTGAGPEIETVQVVLPLTSSVVGEHARPLSRRLGGVIVMVAVRMVPPAAAATVAVCAVPGAPPVAVKVVLAPPLATVAEAGTVNAELLLESVTAWPPAGAALLSVTVQVEAAPAASVAGLQESDAGLTGAPSDRDAFAGPPFRVAVS